MNINDRKAVITFDYEVFLGRETGTIENCVIRPTQLILDILKENNAKAIFFVDAAWLLFLKEQLSNDFQRISEQLKYIIKSGSSIELHLHPQWIHARRTEVNITFGDIEHYKVHSLNNSEILNLFKRSIELLENISNQSIKCFRAGGWCIEPFNQIKEVFKSLGIKYDFSVAPGTYLKEGKVYDFDFSNAPKLPYYSFENDVCIPELKGSFIEIPLSTFNSNPAYRILNKIILKLIKDKIFGDGKGIKEKSIYRKVYQGFSFKQDMLTTDNTSYLIFKYLLKTHFRKDRFIVIVSHPKTISNQALLNLLYITRNYNTLNSSDLDKVLIYN